MIELPDFSKCVVFIRLKEKMGVTEIPILPKVSFTKEVRTEKEIIEPNTKAIELEKILKSSIVSTKLNEITVDENGLLTYKGFKVAAYIRDQRGKKIDHYKKYSEYRYHLCDCSTLQDMRQRGREGRYLTTKRNDGMFLVYDTSDYKSVKLTVKMNLCKNCIKELEERNLWFSPFSLESYFEKYDSHVPKTIKRIETATVIQQYSPNHDDIAREYKGAANYLCQKCNVDCSSKTYLLHLHHRNGNPSDNNHENLAVLCLDCHSQEPMHHHLLHPQKAKDQREEIKKLRNKQGFVELDVSF